VANLLIAMVAVAVVGLVTVTGPSWPSAVFVVLPTVMPAPNLAWVTPCVKFVFRPVIVTVTTSPARAVAGEIEVICPLGWRLTTAVADVMPSTALVAVT